MRGRYNGGCLRNTTRRSDNVTDVDTFLARSGESLGGNGFELTHTFRRAKYSPEWLAEIFLAGSVYEAPTRTAVVVFIRVRRVEDFM